MCISANLSQLEKSFKAYPTDPGYVAVDVIQVSPFAAYKCRYWSKYSLLSSFPAPEVLGWGTVTCPLGS